LQDPHLHIICFINTAAANTTHTQGWKTKEAQFVCQLSDNDVDKKKKAHPLREKIVQVDP